MSEASTLCLEKGSFAGASAALATVYLATLCFAGGMGLSLYRAHSK